MEVRRRRVLAAVAALACLVAIGAVPAAARTVTVPRSCTPLMSPVHRPAILALDPRPHAPRVFAIQYRQSAAALTSLTSFHRTVDCLLRRYVLPWRVKGRPNLVVFDEDTGLATLGIGSRGAAARALISSHAKSTCGAPPCQAIGVLTSLLTSYAAPIAAYTRRFGSLGPLVAPFVGATDTMVRGFVGTFSDLAKRYGLYMVASGDLPAFRQTSVAADVRTFADPDVRKPGTAYVATSAAVHNEAFVWGPTDVRHTGPDVMRNVLATNLKVPLTSIELAIGFQPGPSHGAAAVANVRPVRLPGTSAQVGIATSLPAFEYGSPTAGVNPCSDTASYYMRCLDRLGVNIVIQDEANPGQWTGPDGNGIEQWQPLSWMTSTYRAVADPSVRFAYNVTAMMVGNLSDLVFDGQSAITQRGGTRGPGCHYIGNARFVPGEDQATLRGEAGIKHGFLALAPWVAPDASRATLRRVGNELAQGSGSPRQNGYLETGIVADLPLPVDRARRGCAGVD